LGETVIGLNTDVFVKKYKGKPPIMSYEERKTILNELDYKVVPNDQKDGNIKKVLLEHKIDLIVVGSDWAVKDYVGQIGVDWNWLEEHNIGICYYPRTLDMSTTKIKERIKRE
jgi:glycerol-3-phosphate cytidylyltransferase